MSALVLVIGLVMAVGGAAGMVDGWAIVLTERGWTEVIAGAAIFSGGMVMIGLFGVIREVRRLHAEITIAVAEEHHATAMTAPPPPPLAPLSPAPAAPAAPQVAAMPGYPEQGFGEAHATHEPGASQPEPSGPPVLVATYAAAGINYFMFSNGSIEADMEQGRFRFDSMDELRHYIETGEGGTLVRPLEEQAPMPT